MDAVTTDGTSTIDLSRAELASLRAEFFPNRYYDGEVGEGTSIRRTRL